MVFSGRVMICDKCGFSFNQHDNSRMCGHCLEKERKRNKKLWIMNIRKNKSIDERVSALEEMLFDIKIRR